QHDIPDPEDEEDLGALEDVLEGVRPLTDPFPGGPIDVSLLRCFRTYIDAHIWVSEEDIRPHKLERTWISLHGRRDYIHSWRRKTQTWPSNTNVQYSSNSFTVFHGCRHVEQLQVLEKRMVAAE
ncbi:hypothetical protein Dimus_008263, partial [Dionaea muscipula]